MGGRQGRAICVNVARHFSAHHSPPGATLGMPSGVAAQAAAATEADAAGDQPFHVCARAWGNDVPPLRRRHGVGGLDIAVAIAALADGSGECSRARSAILAVVAREVASLACVGAVRGRGRRERCRRPRLTWRLVARRSCIGISAGVVSCSPPLSCALLWSALLCSVLVSSGVVPLGQVCVRCRSSPSFLDMRACGVKCKCHANPRWVANDGARTHRHQSCECTCRQEYALLAVSPSGAKETLPYPSEDLPMLVSTVCEAVIAHQGARSMEETTRYEADQDIKESKYFKDLESVCGVCSGQEVDRGIAHGRPRHHTQDHAGRGGEPMGCGDPRGCCESTDWGEPMDCGGPQLQRAPVVASGDPMGFAGPVCCGDTMGCGNFTGCGNPIESGDSMVLAAPWDEVVAAPWPAAIP